MPANGNFRKANGNFPIAIGNFRGLVLTTHKIETCMILLIEAFSVLISEISLFCRGLKNKN